MNCCERILWYIPEGMPDREGLIKKVFHAKIMKGEDHEQKKFRKNPQCCRGRCGKVLERMNHRVKTATSGLGY